MIFIMILVTPMISIASILMHDVYLNIQKPCLDEFKFHLSLNSTQLLVTDSDNCSAHFQFDNSLSKDDSLNFLVTPTDEFKYFSASGPVNFTPGPAVNVTTTVPPQAAAYNISIETGDICDENEFKIKLRLIHGDTETELVANFTDFCSATFEWLSTDHQVRPGDKFEVDIVAVDEYLAQPFNLVVDSNVTVLENVTLTFTRSPDYYQHQANVKNDGDCDKDEFKFVLSIVKNGETVHELHTIADCTVWLPWSSKTVTMTPNTTLILSTIPTNASNQRYFPVNTSVDPGITEPTNVDVDIDVKLLPATYNVSVTLATCGSQIFNFTLALVRNSSIVHQQSIQSNCSSQFIWTSVTQPILENDTIKYYVEAPEYMPYSNSLEPKISKLQNYQILLSVNPQMYSRSWIIGVCIGGVGGIIILCVAILYWIRVRKFAKHVSTEVEEFIEPGEIVDVKDDTKDNL